MAYSVRLCLEPRGISFEFRSGRTSYCLDITMVAQKVTKIIIQSHLIIWHLVSGRLCGPGLT